MGFKCKNPDDFVGNAYEGKLEAQVLYGGGNAALLQKMILLSMILLIFCAFGEIALPCSAVIDSRYNAGNAEVLLGREPTGTLALLSALRPGRLGFRKTGHFCLSKRGGRRCMRSRLENL
jgi:hypothetical protein